YECPGCPDVTYGLAKLTGEQLCQYAAAEDAYGYAATCPARVRGRAGPRRGAVRRGGAGPRTGEWWP
ncbi:hypothetical protein ACWELB_49310, partial [Streptomyces asiaticus]